MSKLLLGQRIAILVANGTCEADVQALQDVLQKEGANFRYVSPDSGLVSSWTGDSWGHQFAVDVSLVDALGADYQMLIIPAGDRSLDKLRLSEDTKLFVSSFMQSKKPVVAMGRALLIVTDISDFKGLKVCGPEDLTHIVKQSGGLWSKDSIYIDDFLMSGVCNTQTRQKFVDEMISFFIYRNTAIKAA